MYQCSLPQRKVKDSDSENDLLHQSNITVNSILDDALEGQCLFYVSFLF